MSDLIARLEDPSAEYDVVDRLCTEAAAALRQKEAEIEKLRRIALDMSQALHDQIVGKQSAFIEWQHGGGAEAAMGWIANSLEGPGLIPDEDEPWGKEPQAWYDANKSNPWPFCECGRPSNRMWMGKGFCCEAHYQRARDASQPDAAAAPESGKVGQ